MQVTEQIVKIDRAGRIVIPKEIREFFHLREGTPLKLSLSNESLTLTPQEEPSQIATKDGLLICTGELLFEEDPLKRTRDERTHELIARIGL